MNKIFKGNKYIQNMGDVSDLDKVIDIEDQNLKIELLNKLQPIKKEIQKSIKRIKKLKSEDYEEDEIQYLDELETIEGILQDTLDIFNKN